MKYKICKYEQNGLHLGLHTDMERMVHIQQVKLLQTVDQSLLNSIHKEVYLFIQNIAQISMLLNLYHKSLIKYRKQF